MAKQKYVVLVGDRVFQDNLEKDKAFELANSCSCFYKNRNCSVAHQGNRKQVGSSFMNGKEC